MLTASNICELPRDMLYQFSSFLDDQHLHQLSFVCKLLYNTQQDSRLWNEILKSKNIKKLDPSEDPKDALKRYYTGYCRFWKSAREISDLVQRDVFEAKKKVDEYFRSSEENIPTDHEFLSHMLQDPMPAVPQMVFNFLEAGFLAGSLDQSTSSSIGMYISCAINNINKMEEMSPVQIEESIDALCWLIRHIDTSFEWLLHLDIIYGSGILPKLPNGSAVKIIQAALDKGARFVPMDLCLTVNYNDSKATKALLESGVITFSEDDIFNPLAVATYEGKSPELIQPLVEAGVPVTGIVISNAERAQPREVVEMLKSHLAT